MRLHPQSIRLRAARESRGIMPCQLAKMLGVPQWRVWKIENVKANGYLTKPRQKLAQRIEELIAEIPEVVEKPEGNLAQQIDEKCVEYGLNLTGLAKLMGITSKYLFSVRSGNRSCKRRETRVRFEQRLQAIGIGLTRPEQISLELQQTPMRELIEKQCKVSGLTPKALAARLGICEGRLKDLKCGCGVFKRKANRVEFLRKLQAVGAGVPPIAKKPDLGKSIE